MKKLLNGCFLLLSFVSSAQLPDTVTLDFLYKQVEMNYPLSKQNDLMAKTNALNIQNLNKNYLPQMNINGTASLQSDVTYVKIELPAPLPAIGMPIPAKDQYKLSLDVNQTIWDGNVISYQKKVDKVNLQADEKNLQAQLYQLKDQVNQYYFSIFFLQENESILRSSRDILVAKLKEIRSAVENGTQLQSNADALEAQIIQIDQQLVTLSADRTATFKMLSELVSVTIPETSKLVLPDMRIGSYPFENKRYETDLYTIQMGKTEILKNMVTTKWNPKFTAFGQLGYGRPGFNFLSNDFTTYWIFGGKLTWNFYNWNQNKNEKKILDLQKDIIGTQKETFDKNLRIMNEKNISEILKVSELLEKDQEIIDLRVRIAKSSSSQLDNGVITSSDYVNRLNEETQARQNMELHRVQLIKAKLSYLFNLGKL